MSTIRKTAAARLDFVVLGAPKAGTTAFFRMLTAHPQVYGTPVKEPHFFLLGERPPSFTGPGDEEMFNRQAVWRREDYSALFAPARPDELVGEASPNYLGSADAARRLADYAPGVRLIVLLRDPVQRAQSAYLHLRRDGREPLERFADALDAEPDRIARGWEPLWHYANLGFYYRQLTVYLRLFTRDHLLVLSHDELVREPAALMRRVFAFLGIDPEAPVQTGTHLNVSGRPRSRLVQRSLFGDNALKRVGRAVLPVRARRRLWEEVALRNVMRSRPMLEETTVRKLRALYYADVAELERLLGWELGWWKS
jgi:hypothetical protein